MQKSEGYKRDRESCWKSGGGTNASLYLADDRTGR